MYVKSGEEGWTKKLCNNKKEKYVETHGLQIKNSAQGGVVMRSFY